jgi:hypothetical protein
MTSKKGVGMRKVEVEINSRRSLQAQHSSRKIPSPQKKLMLKITIGQLKQLHNMGYLSKKGEELLETVQKDEGVKW